MREPLAIVGMACRVPGAADYRSLWSAVEAGTTAMVEVGAEDLRREGISLDPAVRNKYVPVVAPLDDYDQFDHGAFGISAGEAAGINLNHRVLMEVVLETLEDAGCDPARFAGNIGLFAAGGGGSPIPVLQRLGDTLYGTGVRPLRVTEAINWTALLDHDMLATRASYALDLRGPSMTVQTACSSSLVALHLACQSVLSGESDMAVAGGVNIELPQRAGYYHQEAGVWSPDGYCRPFDRAAAGTITASGAGAVLIRRLDEALAAGDAVHAVIRGSAVNNDGNRKIGYTAPSVGQQSLVIASALKAAGVDRGDIGYLEAHGTGTEIGDVVEWAALERALGADGTRCAIGATKANLGHLGAAAGIVGLIKAALVLTHGRIPPVANFVELNLRIKPAHERLFVPDAGSVWEHDGKPRRAGVSSMGIGGTNAHVVLEEAPAGAAGPTTGEARGESRPRISVLPVSAASRRSVSDTADRLAEFAAANPDRLPGLSRTLRTGRRVLPHREAIVVADGGEGPKTWRTGSRVAKKKYDSVIVFPGQGGQPSDLRGAEAGIDGFADLLAEALQALPAEDLPSVTAILAGSPELATEPRHTELAVLIQSVTIAAVAAGRRGAAQIAVRLQPRGGRRGRRRRLLDLADAATVPTERARSCCRPPRRAE